MRYLATALGMVVLLAVAAPARAQWFVSPFIGANFGGNTTDASASSGVAAGWMGKSVLGAEAEFAYAPQLFQQTGFLTDHRLTTVMGNIMLGVPVMRSENFHPYILGGLGWMNPKLTEAGGLFALDEKDLGMDLGVGAAGFFNRNIGLRGDVRYFRGLHEGDNDSTFGLDFSSFHYWRTTAGLVVRF